MSAKRDTLRESEFGRVYEPAPAKKLFVPGDIASPITDNFIETSHGRMAVRQSEGPGLPIVFLHGNSGSKDVFDLQFRSALSQAHRLIAIDLPGHGASSDAIDPAESYRVPGYADAVAQVLEALGIEQMAVVGWSLGGHVAFELLASYPGIVGVMTIGAPAIARDLSVMQSAFRPSPLAALAGAQDLSDAQVAEFARLAYGPGDAAQFEASLRRTDGRARALMLGSLLALDFEDERSLVESSDVPIAVVNGAEDPLVEDAYVDSLAYANLWGGRRNLIPRAGHAPFLDASSVFNALLFRWASDMQRLADAQVRNPILTYSA